MSTKALTKAAAKRNNLKDPSLLTALTNGGPWVWLSCLLMGFGNIAAGQIIKGLLFLAVEVGVFAFLCTRGGGIYWISMLPSLGDRPMQEVWNDDTGVYEYIMGDQSQLILLYGIASLCIIALLIFVVFRGTAPVDAVEEEPELSVEQLLATTKEDQSLEDITFGEGSETRKLIEKFVDENPEAVAQLLRNWLNEDWD